MMCRLECTALDVAFCIVVFALRRSCVFCALLLLVLVVSWRLFDSSLIRIRFAYFVGGIYLVISLSPFCVRN